MRLTRQRFGHFLLIALCLGAPAFAYTSSGGNDATNSGIDNPRLDVTRHAMPPPDVTAKPTSTPTVSANPLWAIPLSALTATRNRPLFTPSRRPPEPVVASAPAAGARAPPPPPPAAPTGAVLCAPTGRGGAAPDSAPDGAAASELDFGRHRRR
jgi:general secretion pathway protein N